MASFGCDLMEAYNVPSFDTPKKRKGCVLDNPSMKASSEPYEPYRNSSREDAMWQQPNSINGNSNGNGGSGSKPLRRNGAGNNSNSTREGFATMDERKGFPKHYSGYYQDKTHYCEKYNICPETFTDYEAVPATPQKEQRKTKTQQCTGPLQPRPYDMPLDPEAKKKYNEALQLALNQETGADTYEFPKPLKPSEGDVNGYTDEDLDQFLKTTDMKSVGFQLPSLPRNDQPVSGRDVYASPFAENMRDFTRNGVPQLHPGVSSSMSGEDQYVSKDPWDKVWDMALFIVAGLLLILLLEQLFKLAMLYGMKRAILAIEPLIQQAQLASAST